MKKWTDEQLQASVDGYLAMRAQLVNGERVNKTQAYRALAAEHGKDIGAWARRFGNISQVMDELGYRLTPGLKPLPNVGTNVTKRLASMIQARIGDVEAGLADRIVKAELADASAGLGSDENFSPATAQDQRVRAMRSIVQRRGQPAFRKALMEAYGGRCAVSGCDVVDVLEAAHVFPYLDGETNAVSNGLLLRADIHTIFDLYLLSVDPETRRVVVSPKLERTEYGVLHGVPLPDTATGFPTAGKLSLEWHRSMCRW